MTEEDNQIVEGSHDYNEGEGRKVSNVEERNGWQEEAEVRLEARKKKSLLLERVSRIIKEN